MKKNKLKINFNKINNKIKIYYKYVIKTLNKLKKIIRIIIEY